MLNERQLTLLDLLEQQPGTLIELARLTEVSGRTVLRDIDYLNFTLSGTAHIQGTGSSGYRLEIFDRRRYFQLLQRHDNDDRLLAHLLINAFTTRTQLAEALNLPEAWVIDRLPRLRLRYERAFTLQSRPGMGHFIDEPEEKCIILLANLLKKDPFIIALPGVTPEVVGMLTEVDNEHLQLSFIPGDYIASVILAVYALRHRLIRRWPETHNEALRTAIERAGLYLGTEAINTLNGLLMLHQQRAGAVSAASIEALLQSLPDIARLNIIDTPLVEDLTGHILRCTAAPVWLSENRQGSLNNLKAAWPAAFDLSLRFINQLSEQYDIPVFDSDLVGLYFACALERHQNERQPVILLCEQNAIATINKQAIEREIISCRVIIAHSLTELDNISTEVEPMLIINNSHFFPDESRHKVLVIKNIITAAGIGQIKDFLASAFIRQQPERFFLAEGSFHYDNAPDESWQAIMARICERLVAGHHLTADEAERICLREQEGENLIVNRIAIPHCWSEQQTRFRGFFITLTSAIQVNGEPVNHVLITCASSSARHELKIFSYLASVLYRYSGEDIIALTGHEAFVGLLRE
jgi:putative frv operon regulatory protein